MIHRLKLSVLVLACVLAGVALMHVVHEVGVATADEPEVGR